MKREATFAQLPHLSLSLKTDMPPAAGSRAIEGDTVGALADLDKAVAISKI